MRAKHLMHHAFSISGSGYWLQWCALRPQKKKNCSVLISVLMSRFILGPTKSTLAKHCTTFNNYTYGRQNRLPFGWKCNKQNYTFFLRITSTPRLIDWLVFGDHDIATALGALLGQLQLESFVYCSLYCYTTVFFRQNAKKSLINLTI